MATREAGMSVEPVQSYLAWLIMIICVEGGREKSFVYWPKDGSIITHGKYAISCEQTESFDGFVIADMLYKR